VDQQKTQKEIVVFWLGEVCPSSVESILGGASLRSGSLTSLDFVRFIAFLQRRFQLKISSEEFLGPGFADLSSLLIYLAEKTGRQKEKID